MSGEHILSLLGLALRGGHLAVGEEPVEAVARARNARVLLLASDAADNTCRRTQRFAETGACLWLRLPFSKEALGRALGRTSVALVAITDIGLAAAAVRKLAELDPVRYDEAAAKMDLKAQRAACRRAEQLAHEKNLRAGKRRPKVPPLAPKPPEPTEPTEAPPAPRRKPVRSADRRPSYGSGQVTAEQFRSPESRPRKSGGHPPQSGDRARKPEGRPWRAEKSVRKPEDRTGKRSSSYSSRPTKDKRPKPKAAANPYAHSHPVKKGKGSFRKKEG